MIQQILDFQEQFSNYESVGKSAYVERGQNELRSLRQLKVSEIQLSEEGIVVRIDNKLSSFIKNRLSPVIRAKENNQFVDTNKLLLALSLTKVFFEEKEESIYFPLVSVDLTEQKDYIFSSINSGFCDLLIPWNSPIVINEQVMNTFFSISYEENGEEKEEFIADELGDIVYGEARNDLLKVMDCLYKPFKTTLNTDLELKFPEVNSQKSALFMFFNKKNEVRMRKSFDKIKKNPSKLLHEYLEYKEERNVQPKLNNDIYWLGSLTKEYPLGFGQGLVMQRNAMNDRIIPVIGGPGTGKTTLFLSIIASEVTKRAINIVNGGEDYSNLMLVTSTANKAIDNIALDLKKGFKHGFVYVGGNQDNKSDSAPLVLEFIDFLESMNFDLDKYKYHKQQLKRKIELFEEKRIKFNQVKSLNLNLKTITSVRSFLKSSTKHVISIDKKDLDFLKSKFDLDKILEIMESDIFKKYLRNYENTGILKKIMRNFHNELDLELFNKKFNSNLNKSDLIDFFNVLKNVEKRDLKNLIENNTIKDIEKYFSGKEKFYENIYKQDSFAEYFRTNLFKMNYDFYISSLKFMNQEILRNKKEVIKAVKYFVADNQYKYIIDNYGYEKRNHEKFLRFLSMAYPVSTSTLAAVSGVLSTIKVNTPFNLVLADEAGMIASHSIVETLNRGKRAIIVGDPKQLSPIVSIQDIFLSELRGSVSENFWNTYSPSITSAFHRSAGTVVGGYRATGRGIVLDEHRRCAPKIANLFIDIGEYEDLKICTKIQESGPLKKIGDNLFFFHTKNNDTTSYKKINFAEINKIEAILNRLESIGYNLKYEVGIVTPYLDQERELIKRFAYRLGQNDYSKESKIGTVHKFQGVEYKVIIFSSVISRDHDSLSFINIDPSMINVGVSRAIEVFITVGDYDKLTKDSSYTNYIGRMSRNIKLNGKLLKNK